MSMRRPNLGSSPAFLTTPILMHVAENALDHGHFVFSDRAALPASLAPNRGVAVYAAATSVLEGREPGQSPRVLHAPTARDGAVCSGAISS